MANSSYVSSIRFGTLFLSFDKKTERWEKRNSQCSTLLSLSSRWNFPQQLWPFQAANRKQNLNLTHNLKLIHQVQSNLSLQGNNQTKPAIPCNWSHPWREFCFTPPHTPALSPNGLIPTVPSPFSNKPLRDFIFIWKKSLVLSSRSHFPGPGLLSLALHANGRNGRTLTTLFCYRCWDKPLGKVPPTSPWHFFSWHITHWLEKQLSPVTLGDWCLLVFQGGRWPPGRGCLVVMVKNITTRRRGGYNQQRRSRGVSFDWKLRQ